MSRLDRTNCEEAFRRLDDFLDHRLTPEELRIIEEHLEVCAWCTREFSFEASLLQGVKLVSKQLQTVLERHHCVEIDALHEPFDPHRHQAVMQQASAEHPEHTIVQVLQPGYQLHDRVIRPAQVIVSTAPHSPDPKS